MRRYGIRLGPPHRPRTLAYRVTYRRHSDGWITAVRVTRSGRTKWSLGDDDFSRLLDRVLERMRPCEHHGTVAFCGVPGRPRSDQGISTFIETRRWKNACGLLAHDLRRLLRRAIRRGAGR